MESFKIGEGGVERENSYEDKLHCAEEKNNNFTHSLCAGSNDHHK